MRCSSTSHWVACSYTLGPTSPHVLILWHRRCWPCLAHWLPACLKLAAPLVPSSPMGLGPCNPADGRSHLVSACVRSLGKFNREPNRNNRNRNRKNWNWKIRFLIRFLILRNRNNRRKFGSYSRLTELTERIELHELYFTYLYFVELCLVYV